MPASWKLVLIGGEVTVLAAFTGIGLHLAFQPHRPALGAPPALFLPSLPALPSKSDSPLAVVPPSRRPVATPGTAGLTPGWVRRLGHDDRNLLTSQWDIVQTLIGGIERYLRDTVVPEMERKR